MIINSFIARKVHGFYDFNFHFKPDINFLIGINGSGKTSALLLMQAALSIDLKTLLSIKFKNLKISLENESGSFELSINSTPERLAFRLNSIEFVYDINPAIGNASEGIVSSNRIVEHIEAQRLDLLNAGGSVLNKFVSGARPLFLGLERRAGKYDEELYYDTLESPRGFRFKSHRQRESIEGLDNCKRLVENAFKQFRRASDGRPERLLNIIVESTFEYIEFDPDALSDPSNNPSKELEQLQLRRQEIEKFARDLGGSGKAVAQMDKFFSKMSEVVYSKESSSYFSVEWICNMAQIQRMRRILTEMDRQKKAAEKFYAPIKEFCETMNRFFRHSKKEVLVDSVGKIKITQLGEEVELASLSSGEKQLLILIAHSRFGSSKRSTFIVDEPELSLHMRWQEMLVDALLEGGKTNQFIFATHSPEIVGYRTENSIKVR
jgi:predicted ATPase